MEIKKRKTRLLKKPKKLSVQYHQVTVTKQNSLSKVSAKRVKLSNYKGAIYTVENWALQHYADSGWEGIHSEGSILSTSCMLLSWELVFADIPGVFQFFYQHCPLDLFTNAFYASRNFDIFLSNLNSDSATNIVCHNYHKYQGISCIGIDWGIPLEACISLVSLVPFNALVEMIKYLFENYRFHRAGFPDLFIWTTDNYKFVEVKSANDKLSSKQLEWINLFAKNSINFELLKISNSD